MHSKRRWHHGWVSTVVLCAALMSRGAAKAEEEAVDVLLIPDSGSKSVLAFSAADGSLLDDQFIPNPGNMDGVTFSRPLNAIRSSWGTILVADQLRHIVAEFDYDGNYIRLFAPAGGPDQQILRNIRGIALHPSGDVLVSNTGPSGGVAQTAHAITRFQSDGAMVDPFIFNRKGGIDGPFDVLVLEDMILVAAEGTNVVARYTPEGKFDELFARGVPFPQQIAEASNGNILLAVFSGGYIAEYTREGVLIGQYSAGLGGFRGVAELDNGNLLVTSSTGVHEINRQNQLVDTKFSSSEMRFIERVSLPAAVASERGIRMGAHPAAGRAGNVIAPRTEVQTPELDINSERGEE